MTFLNLLDMTGKEKKRKARAITAQKIAIGVGIVTVAAATGVATGILIAPKSGKETREDMKKTALSFNDAVQKRTKSFKASAANGVQKAGDAVNDIHDKAAGVKEDIKDGLHGIKRDIRHATANISNEFGNH